MVGKKVRFTAGTKAWEGEVVSGPYLKQLTKTTSVEAVSVKTAANLWSYIPLSRITEIEEIAA